MAEHQVIDKKLDSSVAQKVSYVVPLWVRDEQIRVNTAAITARIEGYPEDQKRNDRIAIVCFGPSLQDTWEEIKNFKYVVSCSGSHKFLLEHGIVPTYHVEVDPQPHKVELLGPPHPDVQYLIASCCNPKVFKHLEGYNVKLWHVFTNEAEAHRVLPRGEWAVTGGPSVGLRAMSIARFLGFWNQHIFGMDGSGRPEVGSHAAGHPKAIQKFATTTYNGVEYLTTPSMLECARSTWHELDAMPDVRCLDRRSVVETEIGPRSIKWVVDTKYTGRVVSFGDGAFHWNAVIGHSSRPNRERKPWVSIETSGRKRKLICTDDHLCAVVVDVLRPEIQYSAARDLQGLYAVRVPGGPRNHVEHPLYNNEQVDVLLGTMLGDARATTLGQVDMSHGHKQRDYVLLKQEILGGAVTERRVRGWSKEDAVILRLPTNAQTHAMRSLFYPLGVKTPTLALQYMGPIGLAFWYMDDGHLKTSRRQRPYACFHTEGFTLDEQRSIVAFFTDKLGLEASVQCSGRYHFVRLLTDASERLFTMIAPYIPTCMEYKIPAGYRGQAKHEFHTERLPYAASLVRDVRYLSARDGNYQSRLYDITVEGDHTFVAGGAVVHNCVFYGEGLVQAMAKDYTYKKSDPKKLHHVAIAKPELISDEMRELNARLHRENIAYGVGAGRHAKTVLSLYEKTQSRSVLDYGSGKGYLAKALEFPIWEYDPAIPGKAEEPKPADLVCCLDVLEHVEPDKLMYVLDDLARCVKKIGYFVIHTGAAKKTYADGRNTHLIQKPAAWWQERLEGYFKVGKIVASQDGLELQVIVSPKKKGER